MARERDFNPSLSSSTYAPWYNVPSKPIVSVEHPFIIKNINKGIESLGGPHKLQRMTQDDYDSSATLYIHPGDRMSKPLRSANVTTSNVLLKITVPKRVRVRRRRKSQGPVLERLDAGDVHEGLGTGDSPNLRPKQPTRGLMTRDTRSLIRNLRNNPSNYQMQIIGPIERTHRFRGMSDFVLSTANMPFMKKMQEHILPFDYEKLKGFTFDMSKGVKPNTEIVPPPLMTHMKHPYNYSYRQNPSVKQTVDQLGNVTTTNVHGSRKVLGQPVPFDIPEVPSAPMNDLSPVESLELPLQRLITSARRLLEERPIFTRRALKNSMPGSDWDTIGQNSAKRIYQYCGYQFSAGPWRDAIVRFGVDPRKDPHCRIYQTMMFMLENEPKDSRAKYNRTRADPGTSGQVSNKESHLFDGKTVYKDAKTWQVCDISDPFLKSLLATTDLRKECHIESDGWYHNGTWAKAKIIMKVKMQAILAGTPQDEAAYAKVVQDMPDVIRPEDKTYARLGEDATRYEIHLASQIRTTSFGYRVPAAERAPSQEEDYGDEDREEEGEENGFASPIRSNHEVLDPRLTRASLDTEPYERETVRNEVVLDPMDVDIPIDDSATTP